MKKENYRYLCGVGLLLFMAGCATATKAPEEHRQPAQAVKAEPQRVFVDQPSCRVDHSKPGDPGVIKLSALSGFLVGPSAEMLSKSPDAPTLRPFFTDACSMSPDGIPLSKRNSEVWLDCCIKHDTMYWLGGSEQDKEAADNFLEKCMADKGYPDIGKVYKFFVQKFGGPTTDRTYRWGYGWNYKRPYADVTPAEENQVKVLYGVGKDGIQEVLFDTDTQIYRMCDIHDPVFAGFTPEEKIAYTMLNAKVKKNTLIEWARWGFANHERREFEVQLQSCATPVVITFYSNPQQSPQISDNCD